MLEKLLHPFMNEQEFSNPTPAMMYFDRDELSNIKYRLHHRYPLGELPVAHFPHLNCKKNIFGKDRYSYGPPDCAENLEPIEIPYRDMMRLRTSKNECMISIEPGLPNIMVRLHKECRSVEWSYESAYPWTVWTRLDTKHEWVESRQHIHPNDLFGLINMAEIKSWVYKPRLVINGTYERNGLVYYQIVLMKWSDRTVASASIINSMWEQKVHKQSAISIIKEGLLDFTNLAEGPVIIMTYSKYA